MVILFCFVLPTAKISLVCTECAVCVIIPFSCVTLRTVAHRAPLSMGFSRQEHWSGLPCPPAGDLPNPGIEPTSPVSPLWQAGSFPLVPPGKTLHHLPTPFLMFSSTSVQRLCSHCPGPQVTRPPTWLPWPRAAPGVSPARSVLAPPAACPLPVPPQADGKGRCGPQSRHKTSACRRPARPPGSLGAPGESVCGQGCCRTTLNLRNPTPGPPLLRASHPQRLMYDISPLHSPRCTMPGSRMND